MIEKLITSYMKFLSELCSEGHIHGVTVHKDENGETVHIMLHPVPPLQKIGLSEAAKDKILEWNNEEAKKNPD